MKLRLSDAQVSAIECRDWSEEPVMQRAWQGSYLVFEEADREPLWEELRDASNAEDAQAEYDTDAAARKFAGRASRSLGCVAGKVLTG